MLDGDGFRPNVGIILCNQCNQVLWAKRIKEYNAWQFPQGGIQEGELAEQAMYRELKEELGLLPNMVNILGRTKNWLRYEVPQTCTRHASHKKLYRGQKQIWYLLRMLGKDSDITLNIHEPPEFDAWRWYDYWATANEVVLFKRAVYLTALQELYPYMQQKL